MTNGRIGELSVFDTPALVAAALADAFAGGARTAAEQRGTFNVALAGGTTPKAAYELLAQEPRRGLIDWNTVHVFFGDERCVPPDNPESNYKMAADAFLNAVDIPAQNVHRIRGEGDPQEAAAAYAADLLEAVGTPPVFDLILLGMGPDGHTASLFPGTDPTIDQDELVRAVFVEKLSAHRITVTPRVLNQARHVIIATEGLAKAPALYAVLKGPYDPTIHPVQIVSPSDGRLSWYVDRSAAAELSPE